MNSPGYRLAQCVLAPGAGRRIGEWIAARLASHPAPGPVLDVGCGPASWLWRAGLRPVGVDLSPGRAAAFGRGHGSAAVAASAIALPFPDGCFASVWSFGLLHHLSDDHARAAVSEMLRVTRPGGHGIVFDAVLPGAAWRRPLAWALRRLDRGRWVRTQEGLESLLGEPRGWERRQLTYALTGLEGLLCTYRKPPSREVPRAGRG